LKERILREIIETYIEKDVANFLKIDNITAFNNLIKLLSSNI
jgi:predicted AAA+ superfamily ATPase